MMICLWSNLLTAAVLLLLGIAGFAAYAWRNGAYRRLAVRRRVVVNLVDGTAMQGVLLRHDGPLLVLRDVAYLEPGAAAASLDGDVLVERTRVAFIQAP